MEGAVDSEMKGDCMKVGTERGVEWLRRKGWRGLWRGGDRDPELRAEKGVERWWRKA
jgi:hypothetical protein